MLQIRAMAQNQYSNIGGVESLWDTHTVQRGTTIGGIAAPRYYQVNVTGGNVAPTLPQAATWDPDGANVMYRFMPSVAVDRAGDMALGYTTSSSTTKPAIKYAGRLASDPINTFSQSEQTLIQGTGTQVGSCGGTCIRWGDYSAMTLDPDGCTFWYTSEYYNTNDLNDLTRIGSFAYPSCTPIATTGTLSGTVRDAAGTHAALSGATVRLGSRTTTSASDGSYSFASLPAGTYPSVTAKLDGYQTASASSVAVTEGATTTRDLDEVPSPTAGNLVDTSINDFLSGAVSNTDALTSPGQVILTGGANLEQQNTSISTTGNFITPTSWTGQTFTPAVSGRLTKADVNIFCNLCSGTAPDLTLSVRATSGTVPTGPDLATATISGNGSGAGEYVTGVFGAPLSVTAGTLYALVLRPTAVPSAGNYAATRSTSNVYANGSRVTSSTSGSSWTAQGTDLGFRTYVDAGFKPSGTFTSSVKDADPIGGGIARWGSLSFTGSTPAGTSESLQFAASSNPDGPFSFVGPDGTAGTTFAPTDSLTQFNGLRYLKYRASLATTDPLVTPTLDDVTIGFANQLPQTITFTGAPATAAYSSTFSVVATSTSGLPVTVAATGSCSNVGSSITMTSGTGTCSLTASQPGDGTYLAATSATQSTDATKAPQTVSLTVPASKVFGDAPFAVSGTATSGLTPDLSVSGPCSLTAGNVTITGAGTCTVSGDQAGDANYAAAPTATSDVAIGKAGQSITFAALPDVAVGAAPFTVSATSSSGLPVSFLASGHCTLSGAQVTVGSAGTCTITASQSGDANTNAAADVPRTFSIGQASATLHLSGISQTYDGSAKPVTVTTSPSGLSGVVVTYDGSSTVPSEAGSYAVHVTLSNPDYTAAPVDGTLVILQQGQVITFAPLPTATFGSAPFGLNGTASSGLPVTYAVGSTDTCSVSTDTLTLTGAGSCTVTASQAGDANRSAAADVVRTFAINKGTITLGLADLSRTYDGSPKPVTVTSSPVTVTGISVSYNGSSTAPTNAGSYPVTATLTNADWTAAPVSDTLTIAQATQTITFAARPDKVVGDAPFTVSATSSSGLPVSFAVGVTDGCTISGGTVTVVAAGTCTVTASQAGNANTSAAADVPQSFGINQGTATLSLLNLNPTYDGTPKPVTVTTSPSGLAGVVVTYDSGSTVPTGAGSYAVHATLTNPDWSATPVDGTLAIGKATQTITFAPLPDKSVGDPDFSVSATATSGLTVAFAVGSSDACTISGTTVHLLGAGSCTVTATQPGDGNRSAAAPVANAFAIGKHSAVLTISDVTQVYDGTPKSVTVTTNPPGLQTVTTTYDGSAQAPTDAGSYDAAATLTNDSYSAPTLHAAFVIQKATQVITFAQPADRTYGDPNTTLVATSTSGLPVAFSTSGPCTVSGTTLHLTGAGSCSITASQPGNGNYAAATSVLRTIVVHARTTTTTVSATPTTVQYSDVVDLTAHVSPSSAASTGTVHFTIAGVEVGTAVPSAGVATLHGAVVNAALGSAAVKATFVSSDSGITGSSGSTTITVKAEDIAAMITSPPFVRTSSSTPGSAMTLLSAQVSDTVGTLGSATNDRHPGNVEQARVTFFNRVTKAAYPGCSNLAVTRRAGAPGVGDASCHTTLTASSTNGGSPYAVGIVVGGRYAANRATDDSLLELAQPLAANLVNGGGALTMRTSSGDLAGTTGTTAWAAFGVRYNAARTSLHGTGLVVFTSHGQVYRVSAASFTKITGSNQHMTLTGPATLLRVTDPASPVTVSGSKTLVLTTLRDSNGLSYLGIELRDSSHHLLFSSRWTGSATALDLLVRGEVSGG